MKYARIKDGIVINVEEWQGEPETAEGETVIEVADTDTPFIGYGYTTEGGFEQAPPSGPPYFPDGPTPEWEKHVADLEEVPWE
jgi:hypothetical protein